MEKKYSNIKVAAYVGGEWHEFNYANSSVRDALEQYGYAGDVNQFAGCWDYFMHPIDLTLPDGQVMRMMFSLAWMDWYYEKMRVSFEEYVQALMGIRGQRDAAPYLYHVIKSTKRHEWHDAYVNEKDAEWRFNWFGEEILRCHGYTLADEGTSANGKAQLWHKDGQDDVNVELVKLENNIYRNRKAV